MIARFDEPIRIDRIRGSERIELAASDEECAAIARRLGLAGLNRLGGHAVLTCSGDTVRAEGRLQASLQQSCVVTGDPIDVRVDEHFALLFKPDRSELPPDSELELAPEDCDVVFYDGAAIALGEAIADTLALSLDPYPRSAGAEAALREAGVLSEGEAGPFAALAALKGKLGSGDEI